MTHSSTDATDGASATNAPGGGARAAGSADDVLITGELARREARPPDYEAEARALGALARTLATDPRGLLQQVVDTAMALCRADSTGISVLEPGGEHGVLRWRAIAGAFAANLDGTMPREASPCGDVMHRNQVLLFDRPERVYPALRGVEPPIHENLLAPWEIDGTPTGTLWVIAHAPGRRFDAEDARLLASLARFAGAAWQTVLALDAAEAGQATQTRRAEMREREAARATADLHDTDERLRLAVDLAELGTWEWDLETGAGALDTRAAAIVGLPAGPLEDVAQAQFASIHPDDLAATQATAAAGMAGGGTFTMEYRVVHPDGSVRHVASRARVLTDPAGRPVRLLGTNRDVTAEREAEAALKASEARQAFLVRLSDALRLLGDPVDIQVTASRLVGLDLGVDRVGYGELEPDGEWMTVERDWTAPGVPPVVGRYHIDDFGLFFTTPLREGRPAVVEDAAHDPRVPAAFYEATWAAIGVRGGLACPLVKGGRLVAALFVHSAVPRRWSADEIARVQDVVARTWDARGRARAEVALRAREAQYRLIVESARDYVIFTMDLEGRITSWSPGAEAALGWTDAEAVGQPGAMVFVPEDREAGVPEQELAGARAHGVAPNVRWHLRRDGSRVFIEGTTRALRDEAGHLRGFFKIGQDVTRRRETDEALRASETRFRTLVENVRDCAIFLLDAEGRVVEWPEGARRVKGHAPEAVIGRHLSLFYTSEDVAAGVVEQELAEVAATGRAEREGWRVREGGERFWANEIATAVRDTDGRLVGITKISRDLTERRLATAAAERAQVEAAREELRRALVGAEEAERRRLARELHDRLGQHLTALALGLADARRRLARQVAPDAGYGGETAGAASAEGTGAVGASLTQLEDLARVMTRDARALALELRPPELDDVGLESALESYVAEWAARYGIAAEVAVTGLAAGQPVPPEVATALYRIVQEALTNVARHADATQVSVIVEKPDGEVGIIVEDDGRGFDVEAAAGRVRAERRLGLGSMRERAALVGGTLVIESAPGSGTTLYVRLPVEGPSPGPAGSPGGHVAGQLTGTRERP